MALLSLPHRSRTAHKGTSGRILIVAGSRGMVGAGILTALGAVKAGAGLVRLATVEDQFDGAAKRIPLEVTLTGLPNDRRGRLHARAASKLNNLIKTFRPDVIAIGPGLGVSASIKKSVLFLMKTFSGPLVIDADGLNVLSVSDLKKRRPGSLVITPHPGELGKLFGVSARTINGDRHLWVKKAAQLFNCVCLLKGAGTLISDGKKVLKNSTGNAAMASGGTGDVLTGVIAALWGQQSHKNFEEGLASAYLGAYLHGRAGDMCMRSSGLSIQASTLADTIPKAINELKRRRT
jgi:hydroxyethylthiazole kinase-like uncharacterized protein yjeF